MRALFSAKKRGVDTTHWLNRMSKAEYLNILEKYAKMGVEALQANTPVRTGLTAASWTYEIERSQGRTSIYWVNNNVTNQGQPIAILLQYGHGTGTGGYVIGRDYINPSMKSVFDEIEDGVWRVVTSNE